MRPTRLQGFVGAKTERKKESPTSDREMSIVISIHRSFHVASPMLILMLMLMLMLILKLKPLFVPP